MSAMRRQDRTSIDGSETLRLRLSPLMEDHAVDLERLFDGDWEAVKQTGRMPFPPFAPSIRAWIKRNMSVPGASALIRLKSGQTSIGVIGFGGAIAAAEIGYALGRCHWGRGYATEALIAMVELARRRGFGSLNAYSFIENPASARVLEKAGFIDAGLMVREYPKRGGMRRVRHFKIRLAC